MSTKLNNLKPDVIVFIGAFLTKSYKMTFGESRKYWVPKSVIGNEHFLLSIKEDEIITEDDEIGYLVEYIDKDQIYWIKEEMFHKTIRTANLSYLEAIKYAIANLGKGKVKHPDMGEISHMRAGASVGTTGEKLKNCIRLLMVNPPHWNFYQDIPITDILRNDWYIVE